MAPSKPDGGGSGSDYSSAVVRLVYHIKGERKIAGMGLLVSSKQVVTCAHVVNTALERPPTEQLQPDDNLVLTIEFPLLCDTPQRSGKVVAWLPPPEQGTSTGDIAGIQLSEAAPSGCTPGRFVLDPPASGSDLRAFGYPQNPPRVTGRWVDLQLKGEIGDLIQVESTSGQTIKAQPGYSGSPVWHDATGAVVGLLHSAPRANKPDRDASLFSPQHVAVAWEDPFSYLLIPDNPYRGLEPFTADDAGLFFGRDRDIDQLAGLVETEPVVVVVGPSGVGKSSLIQAGLIPRLLRTPNWSALVMRPGVDALARLADVLVTVDRDPQRPAPDRDDIEREITRLRADGLDSLAQFLRVRGRKLVVLIDQFEELLAADQPPDPTFLDLVFPTKPIENSPIRFVVTLRADYLKTLLDIPGFGPRLQQRTYLLSPLTDDELRDAIERPASVRGVEFESGLVDQLVQDATAEALPLLQFTLTHLWDTQDRKTLSLNGYHRIGRVAGALNRFAEQQMAKLSSDAEQALDSTLFHLIRTPPGAAGLTVRQRAFKSDLTPAEWRVAQHLGDARLATVGGTGDASYVELAHEALLTAWQRLMELVHENAEFLGWLTWVESLVDSGDEVGPGPLSESGISQARHWLDIRADVVPSRIRAFVEASEAHAASRREESQARVIAEEARKRAVEVGLSLRLASEARQAIPVEGETALLVAWEAVLCDRNELTEAVFREALDDMPATIHVLREPGAPENDRVSAGFVDDRTVFIVDKDDATLTFCDLIDDRVWSVAVPGDGWLLAAASPRVGVLTYRSGVVRLHDAAGATVHELPLPPCGNRKPLGPFMQGRLSVGGQGRCILGHAHEYFVVALSEQATELPVVRTFHLDSPPETVILDPTGKFLITERPRDVRVWHLDGAGESPTELTAIARAIPYLGQFNPAIDDDTDAAYSRMDAVLRAFEREPRYRLDSLAFDPRDGRFATTNGDTVDVWAGQRTTSLPAEKRTLSIAFSSDGGLLAAADRRIRVWNFRVGGDPVVLHGHRAGVRKLEFHPEDPSLLLSVDHAGVVRLWRLSSPPEPVIVSEGQPITRIVTTSTGASIIGASTRTTVWSPDTGATSLGGTLLALENSRGRPAYALIVGKDHVGRLWEISGESRPRCYSTLPGKIYRTKQETTYLVAPGGRHLLELSRGLIHVSTADGKTVATSHDEGGRRLLVRLRADSGTPAETRLPAEDIESPSDLFDDGSTVATFRPDGQLFAVAVKTGDVGIFTVDGEAGPCFRIGDADPGRLGTSLTSDPRGDFIIASRTGHENTELRDWEGNLVRTLNTHGQKVLRVAISPDGERILVYTNGGGEHRWHIFARDEHDIAIATANYNSSVLHEVVFDEGRRYIALTDRSSLVILNWIGEPIARLAGPLGAMMRDIACSPGGDLIAVSFSDGTTRIWSAREGRRMKSLQMPLHDGQVVAFSGDGRRLLAGSVKGSVTAYPLNVEDLFGTAAQRVSRPLLPDELERFGVDTPRLDAEALDEYRAAASESDASVAVPDRVG